MAGPLRLYRTSTTSAPMRITLPLIIAIGLLVAPEASAQANRIASVIETPADVSHRTEYPAAPLHDLAPAMRIRYTFQVEGLPDEPRTAAFADLTSDPAFVSFSMTSDASRTSLEMRFDFETLGALDAWTRRAALKDRFGDALQVRTHLDVSRQPSFGEIIDESVIFDMENGEIIDDMDAIGDGEIIDIVD